MCGVDLPMFPLGNVLFPGQLLPLHIFEPRYQEMLEHCLATDNEFGVVLIERGHEVGGGDIRSNVGTVATILEAALAAPGHWAIVAAGTRRVQVKRWHPDRPWPSAEISDFPDKADTGRGPAIDQQWAAVQKRFRYVAGLAAELGDNSFSAFPEFSGDPALGSFQVAALSPLGSFDQQKVLGTDGVGQRLAVLDDLLDEVGDTLRAALALGGDNPLAD